MTRDTTDRPLRRGRRHAPPLLLPALLIPFLALGPAAFAEKFTGSRHADDPTRLQLRDVFDLEWISEPRLSPDGSRVVYQRNSFDIMEDAARSTLWLLENPGSGKAPRPLTDSAGAARESMARWSPDGSKVVYASSGEHGTQLYMRHLDGGREVSVKLTQLTRPPRSVAFSPDGRFLALTLFVPAKSQAMVELPGRPEGARWAEPARVIDDLIYRSDGEGYLEDGAVQLFLLSATGGTPRQLTDGDFEVRGEPVWTPDGGAILFTSNRREGWRHDPLESEIYQVALASGAIQPLTQRKGPDGQPVMSPDGKMLAWVGFEDRVQGYQVAQLSVMRLTSVRALVLTRQLDRSVSSPRWAADGQGLYFSYSDEGNGKIGYVTLGGKVEVVAENVGGTTLGRPYASGSYSVAQNGDVAFTMTRPDHPGDLALASRSANGEYSTRRITQINTDLLGYKELGSVEEFWVASSHDERQIQGWIVKPPGFDPGKKYPLVLEIHGGPFADYGDRFSAEMQLYASAGYVGLYMNPRGSTSYGEEFGNLIHHAYPSYDYDDLMSGVDEVIRRGYVDEKNLFVTGGSGGGVLTAWTVGHTDRFRAAVVAKPVINWTSFVFTADNGPFFWKYWFPGMPWDEPENYFKRSPLSYAGNVKTPTMLLTGELDYRTPISESEQFYQALKLQKVDSVLVRIPGASHGIARRPSQLMTKVAHVL
ncbi:MAG: S9 family peptidase, partial [Acidobacteriota bacterium]